MVKSLILFVQFIALSTPLVVAIGSEVDSSAKSFLHHGLRGHPECYLICIYHNETTGQPKNENLLKGTIVQAVKGGKRIGEHFNFKRVSDAPNPNFGALEGRLFWVFLQKGADGTLQVYPQDPIALREYSEEFQKIVHDEINSASIHSNQ